MDRRGVIQSEGRKSCRSALHAAAHLGDVNQVMDLLQQGYCVSSLSRLPADKGGHALHLAASGGHWRVVDVLLRKGANPDARDQKGFRPLHNAARTGSVEVVKLLHFYRATLEAQDIYGLQATHLAARNGHVQILRLLQSYRCNLECRDRSSATPLHHAAQHGKLQAVEWLIREGVTHDIKDDEGKTAANHAKESNCHQVVAVLNEAISKKSREAKAARENLLFPPASPGTVPHKSPNTIPRLKPEISSEVSPTTVRSSAGIQMFSSESSLTSPSSPSVFALPSIRFIRSPNHSSQAPLSSIHKSRSLTTVTATASPQHKAKQDTGSYRTPDPPTSPQLPTLNKNSIGLCISTLDPPKSILSSPSHLPSNSPPLNSSLPITDNASISSLDSTTPILHTDEEQKPTKKDKNKDPNRTNLMKPKRKSAVIKETCVKVLSKVFSTSCQSSKRNQDLVTDEGRKNKNNKGRSKSKNTEPDGRSLGQGKGIHNGDEKLSNSIHSLQQEAPIMNLQVQPARQPYPDTPDIYSCSTNPRGRVLILNIRSFIDDHDLTRFGSECDITNLENVYHQMGYKVTTRWDLSRTDTLEFFSKESQSPLLRHVSCIFVFIMSHGDGPRTFLTHDLKTVTLDEVLNFFLDQSCPLLKGKPKVFFSHFCRGQDEEIRSTLVSEAKREAYKDMLCIYSSTSGFQAYRDQNLGTPSVRAFCQALAAHAHNKMLCQVIKEFQSLYEKMKGATSPEVQNFNFVKYFFLNPTSNKES